MDWSPSRSLLSAAAFLLGLPLLSMTAAAHGAPGGEATLAGIPNWLYLSAGGLVVGVSFALVGAFANRNSGSFDYRRWSLAPDLSTLATVGRIASVGIYAFVIILGLFGPDEIRVNYAPTFLVEIYWWVTFGIVTVLVGNAWPVVNPWKAIFEWVGEPTLDRDWPASLGTLPALAGFLVFAWLNVVVGAFVSPRLVGAFALGYGAVMVLGMAVFGKRAWLRHGDAFTVVFDLFGRFAPVTRTDGGIAVRGYAVGLVQDRVSTRDTVVFVVALLSVLSFDGFTETPVYAQTLRTLSPVSMAPTTASALVGGAGLLLSLSAFVAAYVVVCWLMRVASGTDRPLGAVVERFVLSLIPIAVAYHVAHYSLYYVIQHEQLVQTLVSPLPGDPLVSDPDIIAGLPLWSIWLLLVGLVVLGHVISVWVAHHVALDFFRERRAALRSQVPMLVLMVGYTVVSLWIISQPFGG
jgi:hypothetical protein